MYILIVVSAFNYFLCSFSSLTYLTYILSNIRMELKRFASGCAKTFALSFEMKLQGNLLMKEKLLG